MNNPTGTQMEPSGFHWLGETLYYLGHDGAVHAFNGTPDPLHHYYRPGVIHFSGASDPQVWSMDPACGYIPENPTANPNRTIMVSNRPGGHMKRKTKPKTKAQVLAAAHSELRQASKARILARYEYELADKALEVASKTLSEASARLNAAEQALLAASVA